MWNMISWSRSGVPDCSRNDDSLFGGASAGVSCLVKLAQTILICMVRIYRAALSPALSSLLGPLGFGCRFFPTCSRYALQALEIHGPWKGSVLAARRLCRCHPWGGEGLDPVPAKDFGCGCATSAGSSHSRLQSTQQSHVRSFRHGTASG